MTSSKPIARTTLDPEPDPDDPRTAEGPTTPPEATNGLVVRTIDAATHATFAREHSASFLQTPAWARVKSDWAAESLGWFHDGVLTGTALVLYRRVPGTRRSLAYVPEGPTLLWNATGTSPGRWLGPMVEHLRRRKAFAVRIGPGTTIRVWSGPTAKRGLADQSVRHFADLPADVHPAVGGQLVNELGALGWARAETAGSGFPAGQPHLSVRLDLHAVSETDLLAGMNQQWRRNIARSVRAGVVVQEGNLHDLEAFHRLYQETAERDGFTPRSHAYFIRMWHSLTTVDDTGRRSLRLYLAHCAGEPLAAAITVEVGGRCWYVYGASTARNRQAQASTAVQWHAIRAARSRGCHTYDLRGIADTLDETDPLSGLLRFKLGLGGSCIETAGEWELALSPIWYRAFQLYLRARS